MRQLSSKLATHLCAEGSTVGSRGREAEDVDEDSSTDTEQQAESKYERCTEVD